MFLRVSVVNGAKNPSTSKKPIIPAMTYRPYLLALILSAAIAVWAQTNQFPAAQISDEDIKVVSFEQMDYPAAAQSAPDGAEGAVVLRVNLDKKGRVTDVAALSGKESLVPGAVANVMKWRFEPNAARAAIVVYDFRIARGLCKTAWSSLTFKKPNLAIVTACWPQSAAASSGPSSQPSAIDVLVADRNMEVLDFEDMSYPQLPRQARVEGTVVVQAKLDDGGQVVDAVALSGHRMFVGYCLKNVKEWRFRPNPQHVAIIVYKFLLGSEVPGCDEGHRGFVLEPPNFAVVSATASCVEVEADTSSPRPAR